VGNDTLTSNPHLWPFIPKARANGAPVICIDPLRTRTAAASDEHIAIRPGTDAALALGMMHVLFRDHLEDRQYLDEMTIGWEKLRQRVLADYAPERVAAICRLPVQRLNGFGTLYGTRGRHSSASTRTAAPCRWRSAVRAISLLGQHRRMERLAAAASFPRQAPSR